MNQKNIKAHNYTILTKTEINNLFDKTDIMAILKI